MSDSHPGYIIGAHRFEAEPLASGLYVVATPIGNLGDIYATAYETVKAGDQVISVTAQGGKLSGPASGVVGSGRVLVPNCHWVNAVAAGSVGLIRMTGINNPRTTT